LIVWAEVLFLVPFAGWCVVRAFDPAANHTEQPMDLMLLTATSVNPVFPPADPWLAGYPIGYYYVGYWLMGTLGQLTVQPPEVAYIVGQGCWFGLLALGCFGTGFNLAALARRRRRSLRGPLLAGVLAVLVVVFASNLQLPVDWIGGWLGLAPASVEGPGWWWWSSSRVVQDIDLAGNPVEVITEFPFFSYLLGDNHPHLLAMPFVLLCVALALNLFLAARGRRESGLGLPNPRAFPGGAGGLALTIAASGVLIAVNTWDYPAVLLLVVVAAAWPALGGLRDVPRVSMLAGLLVAGATVLFLPYLFTAQSQLEGLLPNLFHPTPLPQLALAFGSIAPGLLLVVYVAWRESPARPSQIVLVGFTLVSTAAAWLVAGAVWASHSAAGAAWLGRIAAGDTAVPQVALARWSLGWPSLVVVATLLATVLALVWKRRATCDPEQRGSTFALLLAASGLVLVLAPELVYLEDRFVNRMNTVFKFYYLAWLFLGLAGSYGIAGAWRRGGAARVGSVGALGILGASLIYAPAAVWSKTDGFGSKTPTLDALAYLERHAPGELDAIRWVRANTSPRARIVQAEGSSYNPSHARISTATGRPTLLGWIGHELQWRGGDFEHMSAGRRHALTRIYNPPSSDELQRLLAQWEVDFVFVGPVERELYSISPDHEARIGRAMRPAFASRGVRLYGRRGR
jgi:YYY domain-containing protein